MNLAIKSVKRVFALCALSGTLLVMTSVGYGQSVPVPESFHDKIIGPIVPIGGIYFSDPQPAKDAVVNTQQPPIKIKVRTDSGVLYQSVSLTSVSFALPGCLPIGLGDPGFYVALPPKNIPGGHEYSVLVNPADASCTLLEGPVTVKVKAEAEATPAGPSPQPIKTISATYEWSFTVDTTGTSQPPSSNDTDPPTFAAQQPVPGSLLDTTGIFIQVQIQDASGIDEQSISLTVTGCPGPFVVGGPGVDFNNGLLTVNLSAAGCILPKGLVKVSVLAKDLASPANEGSTSWSFTVGSMPQTPGPKRIGDGNGDGQVNQSDLIVLNQILNGAQASSGQQSALDLAKPCGQLTEKDRKALQKALDKLAKGKKTPKAKCHGKKARVGDPLSAAVSAKALTGPSAVITDGGGEVVRLQVWNLAGKLIWETETRPGLGWDLRQDRPNGVYLSVITVYDSIGQVVRREVHKTVVRR
jgi:hypothetical protein